MIQSRHLGNTQRSSLENCYRVTNYSEEPGDSLNVFHIINKDFLERAIQIFDPRNAMYISRNDGYFNKDVCVQRDTVICANTLMNMARNNYSEEQLNKLKALAKAV